MRHVFADTFFFLALLNEDDDAHDEALMFATAEPVPYLTTEWILTEVADAFSAPHARRQFLRLLELVAESPDTIVVPCTHALFERGVKLFAERMDKEWPLTDCISFEVMREHGVADALTGDHHFTQAGFNVLLKT